MLAAVLAAGLAAAGPAAAETPADRLAELTATLRPAPGAGAAPGVAEPPITWSGDGGVRLLMAPEGMAFAPPATAAGRPEVAAEAFLRTWRGLLGVDDERVGWALERRRESGGRRYVRFRQTHDGLPVFGARILVQLDPGDGIRAVLADLAARPQDLGALRALAPAALAAEDATARARAWAAERFPGADLEVRTPEAGWFVPAVLGSEGAPRRVWQVDVGARAGAGGSARLLIDASDGAPVRSFPLDYAALDRRIYDAANTSTTSGTLVRQEGGPPAGLADANAAYDALGHTYLFYALHHGRDGYDDQGSPIEALVRSCRQGCPMQNALWSSFYQKIFLGEGWAVDDIVAHEFTHAVTDYGSGLIYENASGAMNESFSDIFGELVDLTNGAGVDDPGVRWLIGEELALATLRSMSDPPDYGQPDRIGSPLYVPPTSSPDQWNDYGGVHTNSGVSNKLAFLLTDGGAFNGQTVTAMGFLSVADLFYEVNANLLSAAADWVDLFLTLRLAAANLGWSAADRANLDRACAAVEIAILVVDGGSGCALQTGAPGCGAFSGPFHTVSLGAGVAPSGATLTIRSGVYPETPLLNKRMRLHAQGGVVRIGP